MAITRLFPLSTDVSGSDWTPFGTSPAHVGLSDGSDATGVTRQMSTTEPQRIVKGTAMTQLPATGGIVKTLTVGARAQVDVAVSADLQVSLGGGLLTLSVPDLAASPTNYTAVLSPLSFAQINSLTWQAVSHFVSHDGVFTTLYELYLDVEWYPITGFQVSVP